MGFVAFLRNRLAVRPVPRMTLGQDAPTVYAIGDVHGCLDLLKRLEGAILADAQDYSGEKWLVMLGDYVDRGPDSAGVLDHLLTPLADIAFRRLCIAGNHEAAMSAFLADPARNRGWLSFGGRETLASYGVSPAVLETTPAGSRHMRQLLDSHVPDEHVAFISKLPLLIETPSFIFVHAGLRTGVPLAAQTAEDLMWTRHDLSLDYGETAKLVVHGHTPLEKPMARSHRVAIDTGAYLSGRLTAVRLRPGEAPRFIAATHPLPRVRVAV
jgi:serine/threonine protein phosphatase 1